VSLDFARDKILGAVEKHELYWEGEWGLASILAFSNRWDITRIDQAVEERDRQRLENAGEEFSLLLPESCLSD